MRREFSNPDGSSGVDLTEGIPKISVIRAIRVNPRFRQAIAKIFTYSLDCGNHACAN